VDRTDGDGCSGGKEIQEKRKKAATEWEEEIDRESPEQATKSKSEKDDGRASAEDCTAGQGLGWASKPHRSPSTTPDCVLFTTTTTNDNDPDWQPTIGSRDPGAIPPLRHRTWTTTRPAASPRIGKRRRGGA
jgi:hypothetical protein